MTTLVAAVTEAKRRSELPVFAGGHSFGGRMASHMAAEKAAEVQGLVFCSFPLHPSKKPSTLRAAHLPDIKVPMLFLSGTRDTLADPDLLQSTLNALNPKPHLHWLQTADHSYKILKRTRQEPPTVFQEMATVTRHFMDHLTPLNTEHGV
ncbi:MAG: dienelactone hydrolase family protein [Proteobacteria bacterium]|nr:dienelactone hydrolase family protein [Pseudomonadota bacterium]